MKGSVWLALWRLTMAVSIFVIVSWAMATSPQAIVVFNAQDRVKFFLAAAGLGAIAHRLGRALATPRWGPLQTHTASLACGLAAIVVAAMSSSTWRVGGHGSVLIDGPSRIVFNNLYIAFEVGVLVTAVPADVGDKWAKIGKVLVIAAMVMLAMVYVDQLPSWLRARTEVHDFAPIGPDTDGRP